MRPADASECMGAVNKACEQAGLDPDTIFAGCLSFAFQELMLQINDDQSRLSGQELDETKVIAGFLKGMLSALPGINTPIRPSQGVNAETLEAIRAAHILRYAANNADDIAHAMSLCLLAAALVPAKTGLSPDIYTRQAQVSLGFAEEQKNRVDLQIKIPESIEPKN